MIKILYITKNGKVIGEKIKKVLEFYKYDCLLEYSKEFKPQGDEKGFIFIMATGITLRKYILGELKEYIKDKTKDPFVIAVDEMGNNIIPLLSSHLGHGMYFSKLLGDELQINVSKTTASDVNNKIGIDVLSEKYFLETPSKKDILQINKAVLEYKPKLSIPISWKNSETEKLNESYELTYHDSKDDKLGNKNDSWIFEDTIVLKAKPICFGIGARKDIPSHKVYWTIKKACYLRNIPAWRINSFSTVEVKKNEKGIIDTASKFKKSLNIYSIEELNNIYDNFDKKGTLERSEFVHKNIGTYGVSEPCAILDVLEHIDYEIDNEIDNKNKNNLLVENKKDVLESIDLILPKLKNDGVTVSICSTI
ncbi:cobalt-precorrin 5A hydrolase [Methanococcus voltae PS]|uniref:Cobalt-precorrin 5A hydrolase n=1 Tax=Methanococcus voltae PS TaxID=523842 RepID=A0ABT2EUB2_METVO|nr:cobalamin biosynthesis protein [Methanococcus voltae]MCS3921527.1 cobalt-precorrin 5A hydrolase [Methanococcus voltae PS]